MTEKKNLVVGLKQSRKAVRDGRAVLAYVARDAESRIRVPFEELCDARGLKIEYADTCAGLGRECGIEVGASCAVVLN